MCIRDRRVPIARLAAAHAKLLEGDYQP